MLQVAPISYSKSALALASTYAYLVSVMQVMSFSATKNNNLNEVPVFIDRSSGLSEVEIKTLYLHFVFGPS